MQTETVPDLITIFITLISQYRLRYIEPHTTEGLEYCEIIWLGCQYRASVRSPGFRQN